MRRHRNLSENKVCSPTGAVPVHIKKSLYPAVDLAKPSVALQILINSQMVTNN